MTTVRSAYLSDTAQVEATAIRLPSMTAPTLKPASSSRSKVPNPRQAPWISIGADRIRLESSPVKYRTDGCEPTATGRSRVW